MFDLAYDGGARWALLDVNNMEILQGSSRPPRKERAPSSSRFQVPAIREDEVPARPDQRRGGSAIFRSPSISISRQRRAAGSADDGFTSIMIDALKHLFEENIRITKEVVDYATGAALFVEAERPAGRHRGTRGRRRDLMKHLTDPKPGGWSSGSAPGAICSPPLSVPATAPTSSRARQLAIDRVRRSRRGPPACRSSCTAAAASLQEFVEEINKAALPHHGVPESAATRSGRWACKVKIDTDLRLALTAKIRQDLQPRSRLSLTLRSLSGLRPRGAIMRLVKAKLHVLDVAGKADALSSSGRARLPGA